MEVRIGLVGYQFMGKAHSNAWGQVNRFFKPGARAVLRAVCGRNEAAVRGFAENWGWQSVETDWRRLVSRRDIDVVDIATPNDSHAMIAIEAAKQGKAIICEKPLARSLKEALTMLAAVRKAKVVNMVWHNYRRIPALQLCRRIVKEGRLGIIRHIRAVYLQDWIQDPNFPLVWRLKGDIAGSGAHGDINAHIIDATRFITASEPIEVCSHFETFIKERPVGAMTGGLGAKKGKGKGKVTVDDAVISLARMSNGAIATYEASRFANGRKNGWGFEINGSKGSIKFEFERMNELQFYDGSDPAHLRGFRRILVTEPGQHEYISAWWPPGHIIGYEHTFTHTVFDLLEAMADQKQPAPSFVDGVRNQKVLHAIEQSAKNRKWVRV